MSYDIGVRLGVDGEQAFRSSINAINANIKSMGTELKAVTAQFARNAASEDALAAKNQVLAKSITATKDKIGVLDKQLERQTEKLKSLGDALEEAASAHGKDSQEALAAQNAYNKQAAAVAKLQEHLNGAKADLAEMENAVKDNQDALNGLGREVEKTGGAMEEMPGISQRLGDGLKAGIAAAAKATAAAVAALGAATVALTKSSIGVYSDYEQLVGGVETLFKGSAGQVQEYAQNRRTVRQRVHGHRNQLFRQSASGPGRGHRQGGGAGEPCNYGHVGQRQQDGNRYVIHSICLSGVCQAELYHAG